LKAAINLSKKGLLGSSETKPEKESNCRRSKLNTKCKGDPMNSYVINSKICAMMGIYFIPEVRGKQNPEVGSQRTEISKT